MASNKGYHKVIDSGPQGTENLIEAIALNIQRLNNDSNARPIMHIEVANPNDQEWYTISKYDRLNKFDYRQVEEAINSVLKSVGPAAISVVLFRSENQRDYRASLKLKDAHIYLIDGTETVHPKRTLQEEPTHEYSGLGAVASLQLASNREKYEMMLMNKDDKHQTELRLKDMQHESIVRDLNRTIEGLKEKIQILENDLGEAQEGLLGFNEELEGQNQKKQQTTEKILEMVVPALAGKLFDIDPGKMNLSGDEPNALKEASINIPPARQNEIQVMVAYIAELGEDDYRKVISILKECVEGSEKLNTLYELVKQ